MALKRISKIAAVAMSAIMLSEAGLTSFVPLTVEAREKEETVIEEVVNASGSSDNFTWDNATVYFVLTDRFYNGDKSNDHSYGRSEGEVDADQYETRAGTFHGGDLVGLTQKIEEGYFDDLGVNAIWISAPYEQIHGAVCGNGFKHYAYHGYYPLDFSNMDANMGTEEEMKKFVDTAHEHGIRIVLDVVMNHVGYADPVTVKEYNAGALGNGWDEIYYKTSEGSYQWWMEYSCTTENGKSTLNSSGDWSKWWGSSWIRAVSPRFNGYEGSESGSDLTLCTGGLPDIKTESGSDNGIPPILKTKWDMEGRTATETAELDAFFSKTGLPRKNANYVVKWLVDFVKDYGVDGFRCDTAKHIEKENWGTLSKYATEALKEWREEQKKTNPDNPAAYWDEEFWTTGEHFDHGVGKDEYYTTGGFDSMINFAFKGNESKTGAALESVYSGYASQINSDPSFNVLSYISSHDKGLGSRAASAGTALLLCPGGVQIYYGDETGRTATNSGTKQVNEEQGWRSQMNWNNIDKSVQSNYQKIGQFRNNHASVGAGQHNQLSASPYTFSRTYHLGQADEDKVVVSLPTQAGTFDVTVGDVFADGEVIKDAYSGESYTVSGGKVSVTCDSNGVILLEGSGEVKASVGANIASGTYTGTTYSSETIDVKLSANKVKNATYSINGGAEVAYTADDVITLGAGAAYDEKTVLVLKGISEEDNSEVTKTITYQKCKEPAVSDGKFCVKVLKSEFTVAPTIYGYKSETDKTPITKAWPGDTMVDDGDYWSYTNENITDSAAIIIKWGEGANDRSTPDMKPGLVATGTQLYRKGASSLETLPAGEKATVNVEYVDEAGNDITGGVKVYRVGAVGSSYETSAREIAGYTLKTTPANASGKFTTEDITVTYVYSGGALPSNTPIPSPTQGAEITDTPTPTQGSEVTNTPTPTQGGEVTDTPDPTVAPTEFKLDGFTAVKTKEGVKLIANTSGGNGTIRYMFSYEKDGREILITNFQSESNYVWTTATPGTYKLNAYAINCGTILDKTVETYTVR